MCADSLLVLASCHMLLCSISSVTAEAFQGLQGDSMLHKDREELLEKSFIKPSFSFRVVYSALAWCLPLACGVNIQTLAVMHPWHYSAKTGACWSARAGHSGPQGWVTVTTLCTMGTFPICSTHSSCVHSAAAGWENMEDLFICFHCLFCISGS